MVAGSSSATVIAAASPEASAAPTVRNCTGMATIRMRGASRSRTRSSGGKQPQLGRVGEAEAQRALAGRRIERRRRERRLDQRAEVRVQAGAQPLAAAGQREAAAAAHEERRADRGGQPPQRRADRRLGEVEALAASVTLPVSATTAKTRRRLRSRSPISSINAGHVFHISYSLD